MQALAPAGQVVIPDVGPYEVIDPLFEAVRLALAQRGDVYPAAYIQGISGSAFRIAGICPCAPTCSNASWPDKLLKQLGYSPTMLSMEQSGATWAELESFAKLIKNDRLPDPSTLSADQRRIYDKALELIHAIQSEVSAGRPVLVWHAFTNAEYDIVCGYDAEKHEFIGRGSYKGDKGPYAHAGEARMITAAFIGGWPAAIVIGQKTGSLDKNAADIASITEAVRHGRDQANLDKLGGEKWVMLQGIAAYDRWAKDFQSETKKRQAGDAYCFGIYSHTHSAAGPYLRSIAPRYPKASEHLLAAATAFEQESQTLKGGQKLLWWTSPDGPDAQRNKAAAELLTTAASHYKAGVEQLEKALPLMQ